MKLSLGDNKKTKILICAIVIVILVDALIAFLILGTPGRRINRQLALGNKYLIDEDYDQAVACFKNAIAIDPMNPDAYIGLADVYMENDDLESAKTILEAFKLFNSNEDSNSLIQEKLEEVFEEIEKKEAEIARKEAEAEQLAIEKAENEKQEMLVNYLESVREGFEVGNIFPDFQMKDHDGKTVNLSDYRGEVLYLNFFTTWCPYCYYELPDMNEMKSRARVLLVDVDSEEGPTDTDAYLKEYGFDFEVNFHDGWNIEGYEIDGVPTSFVIDEYGIIRAVTIGMADRYWMESAVDDAENGIYDDLPQLLND